MADWVESTAARPNGVCKVNGMFGNVFFENGLSRVGRTSSQRYDGRAGSPLRVRKERFSDYFYSDM